VYIYNIAKKNKLISFQFLPKNKFLAHHSHIIIKTEKGFTSKKKHIYNLYIKTRRTKILTGFFRAPNDQ